MVIFLRVLGVLMLVESGVIDFYNFRSILNRAPDQLLGYVNAIAAATPTFTAAIVFFALSICLTLLQDIYRPQPYWAGPDRR